MELVERAWTPYLIPVIGLAAYEAVMSLFSASLMQLRAGVTEPNRKSRMTIALYLAISYFAMNV